MVRLKVNSMYREDCEPKQRPISQTVTVVKIKYKGNQIRNTLRQSELEIITQLGCDVGGAQGLGHQHVVVDCQLTHSDWLLPCPDIGDLPGAYAGYQ